jgi:hypothetical protein
VQHARFVRRLALAGQIVAAAAVAMPLVTTAPAQAATPAAAIAVHGTVTASGKANAGATVYIYAWPDETVLQALKIGQTVPRVSVGETKTNASGQYAISLPVTKLAPEATSGVVNLEIGTSTAAENLSVVIAQNAGNAYLAGTNPVVNLQDSGKNECSQPVDSWHYYASMKKHWATVGQTYVATTDATQQFSYSLGQFSTIGAGTSTAGADGPFSADGSSSWSNSHSHSSSGSWPVYGARRSVWYRTQFHFGEYRCHVYGIAIKYYMERVNGYDGGGHIESPSSAPRAPDCENYVSGYKFTSNNSTAVTWRHSWGIHAGLSFLASVVTGYDKDAQIVYQLHRSRDICGTNDYPGGNPRQLVVRQ